MARVHTTSVFLALALFPCGSIAATLTVDQHVEKESMIRRESGRVEVSALGEIVHADDLTKLGTAQAPNSTDATDTATGSAAGTATDNLVTDTLQYDYCDIDFPLGNDGTNNCSHAEHALITDPNVCEEAAARSGATTLQGHFEVTGAPYAETRPKGCFKEACGDNNTCYFFNEYGGWPGPSIDGTPVCHRPKLLNGTKDTNGGCPATYAVIDHEDVCRQAANCWDIPIDRETFRIGFDPRNASKHLLYPRGCFIDVSTEPAKVFFNPDEGGESGTNVKGIPICNVTSTVAWR